MMGMEAICSVFLATVVYPIMSTATHFQSQEAPHSHRLLQAFYNTNTYPYFDSSGTYTYGAFSAGDTAW